VKLTFHVLDVVTVATGYLVAPSHIDAVYKLCGHMLGDPHLFTHQLPAASRACEPALVEAFPWLTALDTTVDLTDDAIRTAWCAQIVADRGEWVEVERIDNPPWHTGRALSDLVEMVGADRVVPVVIDEAP